MPLYHLTITNLYNYLLLMIAYKQDNIHTISQKNNRAFPINTHHEEGAMAFITKDFLNNLKLELVQKVKPSKSILQALKHSNNLNQSYKKNIQELNIKIQKLALENTSLKEKLGQLEYKIRQSDIANSKLISEQLSRSMQAGQLKNLQNQQTENEHMFEIQILRQKIEHLQQFKRIKQIRFNEIIQRQAQYVGEINILKYQNQTMQSSIKILKSSLHQLKQQQSTQIALDRKKSEASQKFKEYINHDDSFKEDKSLEESIKQIKHLIIPKNNHPLLESMTKAIEIQEPYNIEAMEQRQKNKRNRHNNSFLEIDTILADDLSSHKASSNKLGSQKQHLINVNNSEIDININNNSLIAININGQQLEQDSSVA